MPYPFPSDEEWDEPDDEPAGGPDLTVYVTDNPVVAELLGPDGEVLAQWLEREPIGFRIRNQQGD